MTTDRRVHTLHLTAPDDRLIRRGTVLLEDALHTASLPDADGGMLLLVRSLNLGTIDPRGSAASVALNLEQRFRHLSHLAVLATDPAAPSCPVVYFPSVAVAYQQLALRLARQEPTTAWFWSLAVPDWQPTLPRSQALKQVLFGILRLPAGIPAAVQLVITLQTANCLDELLTSLNHTDGTPLLQAVAGALPNLPFIFAPPDRQSIPDHWLPPLHRWIQRWGNDDHRTLWLAAIVLLAVNPTRLLDSRLAERTQQLIRAIGLQPPAGASPSCDPSPTPAIPPTVALPSTPHQTAPLPTAAPPSTSPPPSTEPSPSPEVPASLQPLPPNISSFLPPSRHPPLSPSPLPLPLSPPPPISPAPIPHSPIPIPSPHAGFLFLLPLLNHLELPAFLQNHPHLIERDFPRHLLQLVGQRLAVPTTDPILTALFPDPDRPPATLSPTDPSPCAFTVPASWQSTIANGEPSWYQDEHRDRQLRIDCSHRLILALHHPIPPSPYFPIPPSPFPPADFTLLLHTWLTALRRWCRRCAQMGLHALVHRPGQIVATPTHIDLLFQPQQADIRVRRVGLDLDPGWVPWLGKVVLFHYRKGV